ncbi:MAG: DUF2807 domain-containing protein [Candidatus Doudnabacteria bacterium]|nr:DUF2807 domain-containing protein [Candidatus Doudnabacteria bacterium]
MQKTINVNLAGRIFYVEEDAYAALDGYLQDIKQHFHKFEDSSEILADIEARIAEQLLEQDRDNSRIVQKAAVDQVMQTMGKPSDFADAEDGLKEKTAEAHEHRTNGTKRLYRDGDDSILGGVASGTARYFDTDPLWIRILFVASVLLGGYGILIYIVLWIIVPKASTLSEKLEMSGNKITLESLEKSIKEKIIHNPKAKQGAKQVAEAVRPAVRTVRSGASLFLQTLLRLLGLALTVAATAGIIGLVVGGTAFVTGSTAAYTEFPIRDFLGLPQFYAALCALFFIAFVPLLLFLLAGLSLLALKSRFSRPAVVALIVLWVAAAAVAAGLTARHAPRFESYIQNQPAYQTKTIERPVTAFTKLRVSSGLQVQLMQAETPALTVTGVQSDLDRIHTDVSNDTLTVSSADAKHRWCLFCMHQRPRVTVTVPALTDISTENGARLQSDIFRVTMLRVKAQNASAVTLENIAGQSLELLAENASSLTVSGNTDALTARAQNASKIHAEELRARTATVEAENASRITVQPTQSLDARSQNSSRIYYRGTPLRVTGSASQAPETDSEPQPRSEPTPVVPPLPPIPPIDAPLQ